MKEIPMNRTLSILCVTAVALTLVSRVSFAANLEIGAKAPDFTVTTIEGKPISLSEVAKDAKAVVVCFTCNQCPVAVAYEDRFIEFNKKYADKGVKFVAINVNYTENLEQMKARAEEKGFNFPYAYDDSGDSARAYGARVTPHLFVINSEGKLVFKGSFDDNTSEPKKHFVSDAVEAVLAGNLPSVTESQEFGCGIRLKR
jgi:peroxiredoxin